MALTERLSLTLGGTTRPGRSADGARSPSPPKSNTSPVERRVVGWTPPSESQVIVAFDRDRCIRTRWSPDGIRSPCLTVGRVEQLVVATTANSPASLPKIKMRLRLVPRWHRIASRCSNGEISDRDDGTDGLIVIAGPRVRNMALGHRTAR